MGGDDELARAAGGVFEEVGEVGVNDIWVQTSIEFVDDEHPPLRSSSESRREATGTVAEFHQTLRGARMLWRFPIRFAVDGVRPASTDADLPGGLAPRNAPGCQAMSDVKGQPVSRKIRRTPARHPQEGQRRLLVRHRSARCRYQSTASIERSDDERRSQKESDQEVPRPSSREGRYGTRSRKNRPSSRYRKPQAPAAECFARGTR